MIKIRTAIFIFSILLFSCNPIKRVERNCSKWQSICKTERQIDTIIQTDTIIYHDTVFEYHFGRDTVSVEKIIEVPKYLRLNIDTIEKLRGIIGVRAGVVNNLLWAEGFVNDSTIFIKFRNAIKEIKSLRSKNHSETIVKEKVSNSSFAHFTIWFFWIFLIAIFIYALIRYFRLF